MISGCCQCKRCGHPTAGEFHHRTIKSAHYQCRCCHLWYSHEISDLEDVEPIEESEGVTVPVSNAHVGTF